MNKVKNIITKSIDRKEFIITSLIDGANTTDIIKMLTIRRQAAINISIGLSLHPATDRQKILAGILVEGIDKSIEWLES